MPELPEVEVLVRHLAPLVRGRTIHDVTVRRARVLRPTSPTTLRRTLRKARILNVSRRAKYLVFDLRPGTVRKPFCLVAHLGMTGRIYLAPKSRPLPKHAAVVLDLGRENLIYEDPRYFGRFMLDAAPLQRLGPEPLAADFSLASWQAALRRSTQAIKVKLLDQSLIAGIGNIYASEALHWAAISPRRAARSLSRSEAARLRRGSAKCCARQSVLAAPSPCVSRVATPVSCFITAVIPARRIITRNDCGYMTGRGNRATAAAGSSGG